MSISSNEILKFYKQIFLIRECENKIREEYPFDQIKTPVHLCVGAEAIHAGVLECLGPEAKIFGSYRNHGIYLARTGDTDGFFGELYGKASGCAGGKAGSMHLAFPEKGLMFTSAVVGTTIPVAVGAAFANAYRGNRDLTVVFFGDGAFEEGAFWESINFACLHRLRILFVCEDNGLAIHALSSERQGFRSIPEVVRAFACHFGEVRGHKADEVFRATQGLMEQMEQEAMPAFLYAPYFRFLEHVGISEDFHFQYRKKPDAAEMTEKDPLVYISELALHSGIAPAALREIEDSLRGKILKSIEKAKKDSFPGPESLFCNVSNETGC